MRYIDNESIALRKEEENLRKAWEEKQKEWQDAANNTNSDEEYDKTRPLFDESIELYKKWKEYQFLHGKKLFMQIED